MNKHATLFVTHRGLMHQNAAKDAAPADLDVTIVRSPSKEELLTLIPGKEFLISERTGVIDTEVIAAGKNLRLIQRLGSQTQDIDLEAATAAGIPVCYWPIRTCIMVAEHLFMQMLGVSKRVREAMVITQSAEDFGNRPTRCNEDTFAYNWAGMQDIRGLWGSKIGILGMGEIGFELSRRLRPFGCKVIYNKRNCLPAQTERDLNIQYADWNDLVSSSDYVCVLLPLFDETDQCLNAEFFAKMKQGASFISSGGSGVIDEKALADAVNSGKLYGAAVDNFTWEPIRNDSPLLKPARDLTSNLILTPHIAAATVPVVNKDLRLEDYQNISNILKGKPLDYQLV